MTDSDYSTYLSRIAQLQRTVWAHVSELQIPDQPRFILSFKAGSLSLQLANGTFRLIQAGSTFPAIALIRPQFECLVRGVWLRYTATDVWVEKLSQRLTLESAKRASRSPSLSEMLGSFDAVPHPRFQHFVGQLHDFHKTGTMVLNSFTHGGMVPLVHAGEEYPEWMVKTAIQNSTNVLVLAGQLLSILTCDPKDMEPMVQIYDDFQDCLKFERVSFD